MGKLINEKATVLSNENVGPRLWLLTVRCPQVAAAVRPGQFVHMLVPGMADHMLRRPFSVYRTDVAAGTMDILYQVVGYGTDHMTALPVGTECEFIGSIGRGWEVPEGARKVLLVAGGVGAAPLFMLTQQCVERGLDVTVVLGAQTKDALVLRPAYAEVLGEEPRCATDDGTYGRAGFCTSLVEEALAEAAAAGEPYDYLAVCGPLPLMRIVAGQAKEAGVFAQVSMEKRMACGIGACLGCIVDTVDGNRRACVDGPIFDAQEVVW
ncbi:MAG: dihydroorotate dehydrogenase electron transfer subunit [Coriobacteriia bacterium]|nr:dihydroorotate dehydrogenase electron transfer subunit [Coriobacteriia bacterium]